MKCTKIQRTRMSTSDQKPSHSWLSRVPNEIRGTRTKYSITHAPSTHQPGEEVYIKLSNLGSVHIIDPNSINFTFVFNRTDSEANLFNNLSANLVQRLIISLSGKTIYDNSHENLMRTYSDLWLSQRAREELTEFGVCDELLRNSGTETDETNGVSKITKKLCHIFKRQKIPIGKIISDQGLMVPSANIANLEFTMVLSDPSKVLSKGSYTLSSCEIEYDIIKSNSLRSLVVSQYTDGKSLPFKGLTYLYPSEWSKNNMLVTENINFSAKCLNQIIMLFTRKKRRGSEEFVFPGISSVNVTFQGVPGSVYNAGIKTVDLLTEARKTFTGHMKPHTFFCGDMFALCVDFRSVFTSDEYGVGRNTMGGSNIVLEIHRDPDMVPDEDLKCHVYVGYDAVLNVSTQGLISLVAV